MFNMTQLVLFLQLWVGDKKRIEDVFLESSGDFVFLGLEL